MGVVKKRGGGGGRSCSQASVASTILLILVFIIPLVLKYTNRVDGTHILVHLMTYWYADT